MDIEIKKLSPALLEDWLEFFDNIASPGDGEWEGCYCMCYHWTDELEKRKSQSGSILRFSNRAGRCFLSDVYVIAVCH